ncbi:MAG: EAL domain-containing protein [Gammaproteobacteria bacterium]|nr:EAL domain-containing protein [Gammaproteobacteria bacterium]
MAAEARSIKAVKNTGKAAALLRSLVPEAQVFCFYDLAGSCVWNTSGASDNEIDSFVAELVVENVVEIPKNDTVLKRTLRSGRTLLTLPVCDHKKAVLGIIICVFSMNAGKSSAFDPQRLKETLEPAAELIGEGMRVSHALIESNRLRNDIEKELMLVYEIDEKIHSPSRGHSNLAQLVGQSGRYVGINYSVLLIPSKRIRISATHSSWKKVNRRALDSFLIDNLLPKLPARRDPMILDIPPLNKDDSVAGQGFQAMMSPIIDQQGNVEGLLAQLGRVDNREFSTRDQRFMAQIVRKAEHVIAQSFDMMTGLMNRMGFEAQLQESYKALATDEDTHQIIYLDLDNLQLVNDTFSHEAGDQVIKQFARLLEEDLPKSAVLSRITGDDFCMLLTHADADAAMEYANKIREKRSALRYLEGDKSLQVTMSIGIAEFSKKQSEEGNALTTARMACEAAKDYGGDRIEVFDDCNQSIVRRFDDMQLVAEIQKSLDGDGFRLVAQPLAALGDVPNPPRFEVLLRMGDGQGGSVPAKALFSAAERYQMMPHIDRWVISTVLSNLKDVADSVTDQQATFAINLSGQSLADEDILAFIGQEIKSSGLPPSLLCFEITESAAVTHLKKAQAFIDGLRKLGCSISLDDFGAGLSSFAYLKNFNVDTLKIDGGFVHDISENRISKSMVAAIAEVAKVMELKTVAEFVGSAECRDILVEIGVDYAQGHFIGKPIPIEKVLAEISDQPGLDESVPDPSETDGSSEIEVSAAAS